MRRYEHGVVVGEPEALNSFDEWLDDMVAALQRIHERERRGGQEGADLFLNGRLSMIEEVKLAHSRRSILL